MSPPPPVPCNVTEFEVDAVARTHESDEVASPPLEEVPVQHPGRSARDPQLCSRSHSLLRGSLTALRHGVTQENHAEGRGAPLTTRPPQNTNITGHIANTKLCTDGTTVTGTLIKSTGDMYRGRTIPSDDSVVCSEDCTAALTCQS